VTVPRKRTFDPQEAKATPSVASHPDRACQGVDAEEFYPTHATGYLRAVQVCRRCPVEAECLAWALNTRQSFGVWGGKTPDERHELLKGQ
jgi:WhiB family redox-sensing transcriptional regulator